MDKIYIGIDPGSNGGIAVSDMLEGELEVIKMPPTFPDIYNTLKEKMKDGRECVAVLEDVGQGIPGQSSASTAKFARHIGNLEMALYALGIRTELVKPQKWMKTYSNTIGSSRGKTKGQWKNALKGEAQRLFPFEKVTMWNADALLILEYARRQHL